MKAFGWINVMCENKVSFLEICINMWKQYVRVVSIFRENFEET